MNFDTFSLVSYPFIETRKEFPDLAKRRSGPAEVPLTGYRGYFDFLQARIKEAIPGDNLSSLLSNYLTTVGQASTNIGPMLMSPLTVSYVNEFAARWSSMLEGAASVEHLETILAATAAFLVETSKANQGEFNLSSTRYGAAIISEMGSYNAWLVSDDITRGTRKQHTDALDEFAVQTKQSFDNALEILKTGQQAIGELRTENATALKEVAEAKLELDRAQSFFKSSLNASNHALKTTTEGFEALAAEVSTRKDNIEAFKEALREEAKIEAAKQLWDQRATAASRGFWTSAILLFLTLVFIPVMGFCKLDSVIAVLRHISETTLIGIDQSKAEGGVMLGLAINRIVIVTVPLALYFWMVRMLVRFNLRSQVLMDDARQRHTMMNTYFHLIEKQSAVKEDRALILNALFRPTPGQQNDSVDPPNFTELMDKAIGRH
ncbi:DUF6161 domain-containing protein [Rhizobium sp. BK060]|uniref:DUF6161 domain-containing protein n=1 Tax=Rhizobium sp. BK060 TaxID=2587096 RepID=UPI0016225A25|nr:DUF6161 domain-containing protein [Rhizobium sp. BK060]MBB3394213.1 hypothetical protein [Rhizobium sp. BK060]